MTYPLSICNGYVIIDIDGEKFMLDTGAPSMSTKAGNGPLRLGGKTFPLRIARQEDRDQLERGVGIPLSGLIGTDVLSAFGGITCDIANGIATFGVPTISDGVVVPFEKRNDFHFHVRVNGKNVLGFLDVVAPKPMIDDHSLLDASRDEGNVDEPSMSGVLRTRQFGGEIEFGGVAKTVHTLRSVLQMNRDYISQVYFGLTTFAVEYFAIDLQNQTIQFK